MKNQPNHTVEMDGCNLRLQFPPLRSGRPSLPRYGVANAVLLPMVRST